MHKIKVSSFFNQYFVHISKDQTDLLFKCEKNMVNA